MNTQEARNIKSFEIYISSHYQDRDYGISPSPSDLWFLTQQSMGGGGGMGIGKSGHLSVFNYLEHFKVLFFQGFIFTP